MTTGTSHLLPLLPFLNSSEQFRKSSLMIGPWSFQPANSVSANDWISAEFEAAAKELINRYESTSVLVGRYKGLLIGNVDSATARFVQPALLFGLLDAQVRRGPMQLGMQTSDNTQFDLWPIDASGNTFTLQSGSYVRTLHGHDRSDEACRIPTPFDTPTEQLFAVRPNDDLATVCYLHLTSCGPESAIFGTALRLMGMAWRNDRSISVEDRVICLRTAFESIGATQSLAEMYKLASETLSEVLIRKSDTAPEEVNHFGKKLSELRNNAVHKGSLPDNAQAMQNDMLKGSFSGYKDFLQAGTALLLDLLRHRLVLAGFEDVKVIDKDFHKFVMDLMANLTAPSWRS
jgi:hypothetical protein